MRSTEEIKEEIRKVEAAKRTAVKTVKMCDGRLLELALELAENTAEESRYAET